MFRGALSRQRHGGVRRGQDVSRSGWRSRDPRLLPVAPGRQPRPDHRGDPDCRSGDLVGGKLLPDPTSWVGKAHLSHRTPTGYLSSRVCGATGGTRDTPGDHRVRGLSGGVQTPRP